MKGEVNVESTPSSGSSFTFDVLLEKSPGSEPPFTDPKIKGLKVVLIDPSAVNARVLIDYLVRLDCDIEHFITFTDGLQEISHRNKINKPADLVIVDLEAAKLAQGSFIPNPAWEKTGKLLLHYKGSSIPKKISEMGFGSVLQRPFLPAEFWTSVYNAFTKKVVTPVTEAALKPLPRTETRNLRIRGQSYKPESCQGHPQQTGSLYRSGREWKNCC